MRLGGLVAKGDAKSLGVSRAVLAHGDYGLFLWCEAVCERNLLDYERAVFALWRTDPQCDVARGKFEGYLGWGNGHFSLPFASISNMHNNVKPTPIKSRYITL